MADEANIEQAPTVEAQQQEQVQADPPNPRPRAKPKAKGGGDDGGAGAPAGDAPAPEAQPRPDPMMTQLVAAQRELDAARKELEAHRAKVRQYERDQRKASILSALVDEFPGLPRQDIRGAALVAAEDGHIDLYAEDPAAAIAHITEMLRPKSKAKPSTSSPPASLGGTPGSPSKPPSGARRFLI